MLLFRFFVSTDPDCVTNLYVLRFLLIFLTWVSNCEPFAGDSTSASALALDPHQYLKLLMKQNDRGKFLSKI